MLRSRLYRLRFLLLLATVNISISQAGKIPPICQEVRFHKESRFSPYSSEHHSIGYVQVMKLSETASVDDVEEWNVENDKLEKQIWDPLFRITISPGESPEQVPVALKDEDWDSSIPLLLIKYDLNTANLDDRREGWRLAQAQCGLGVRSSVINLGFAKVRYTCRRRSKKCKDMERAQAAIRTGLKFARLHHIDEPWALQKLVDKTKQQRLTKKRKRHYQIIGSALKGMLSVVKIVAFFLYMLF